MTLLKKMPTRFGSLTIWDAHQRTLINIRAHYFRHTADIAGYADAERFSSPYPVGLSTTTSTTPDNRMLKVFLGVWFVCLCGKSMGTPSVALIFLSPLCGAPLLDLEIQKTAASSIARTMYDADIKTLLYCMYYIE